MRCFAPASSERKLYSRSDSWRRISSILIFATGESMVGYNVPLQKKTRPDTGLRQSRAGGQEPYLRSLDHLGRSSEVKKKNQSV